MSAFSFGEEKQGRDAASGPPLNAKQRNTIKTHRKVRGFIVPGFDLKIGK